MTFISPAESGPALNRRIGLLVDGPRSDGALAYSTDERAADALAARLEEKGIKATLEQDSEAWYCVFWAPRPGDDVAERVASGSAASRPLAICRAILNLPLSGSGRHLHLRRTSRGWIGPDETGPRRVASDDGGAGLGDAESPEPARAARES
jgi:hypothetical protein